MTSQPETGYPPVRTHITSIEPGLSLGAPAPKRRLYHVIPRTVVLTADEPVKQLLRPDPNRCAVLIIARTNDVVLCESKGDGQAAANVGDATLANPNGGVIPHDTLLKIDDITSELWAAGPTYPTRVTVIATYRK